MKVLLIKPPIRSFLHEIGRHCPIGLAYLAAALRQAGHEVTIFDSLAYTEDNHVVPAETLTARERLKLSAHPRFTLLLHWGATQARIARAIQESDAEAIGVSCMFSPFYDGAFAVADLARQLRPKAVIVMGGQHPTIAAAHVLRECPSIDAAVLGEAEQTVSSILTKLSRGESLDDQEGVAFRCGEGHCRCQPGAPGALHHHPRTEWLADLDTLAPPATDLIDFDRYGRTATLITSRGCPFSCTFCTVHAIVGRRFRHRRPDAVVDEIEYYARTHGVESFAIEDDNFTFSIPRVEEICDEIVRRGLHVRLTLPNGMTAVKLSEPFVDRMARAGFSDLFLGLESTDDERLTRIAKRFTSLNKVADGYRWFRARGVSVAASLIVGMPGQGTREIARDVMNLALRGIRFWSNPFYPIPGSPDYDTCLAQGVITEQTDYVLFDQYNFAIRTSAFTPAELYRIWLMTQTTAHWPDYVLEGRAPDPPAREPMAAAARLVEVAEAKRSQAPAGERLECPAEPCAVYWRGRDLCVAVHGDSCFGALHRIPNWDQLPELNRFTGDVVAAALSLYTGRLFDSEPLAAPEGEPPGARAYFRLREIEPDALFAEFVDELSCCARSWERTEIEDAPCLAIPNRRD